MDKRSPALSPPWRTPRSARGPLGERNEEAEPSARRRAANIFSAGISALTPRMGGNDKVARKGPVVPPLLTGLTHGTKEHLEALAALASIDDLCDLDTPDIVRAPTPRARKPYAQFWARWAKHGLFSARAALRAEPREAIPARASAAASHPRDECTHAAGWRPATSLVARCCRLPCPLPRSPPLPRPSAHETPRL